MACFGGFVYALFFLLLAVSPSPLSAMTRLAAPKRSDPLGPAPQVTPHELDIGLGPTGSNRPRRVFDGIGALSAGASSRLLIDYPEPQRTEILDLLFLPGYGASLQVLKVEIGGDAQSTDGSEPSHMHTSTEAPSCSRGYEFWLLKEAKKRNPAIITYALAWGTPGWIGDGKFFSEDNLRYQTSWLTCVRDKLGFAVDYVGIWNESPWGDLWYIDALRRSIDLNGMRTQLVLLDEIFGVNRQFVSYFENNETFRSLVNAVGLHYPCNEDKGLAEVLKRHPETRLWASEESSTVGDWGGAGCWGRLINQNYVRMQATSSIAWSLVWSAYPNLECFGQGLMYAYEPWSGHYEVSPPVWTTAHTTAFTAVGWEYLRVGDGAGELPDGGTYVTLVDPEAGDFTVVLETLHGQCQYHNGCYHHEEAKKPQLLRLHLDLPMPTSRELMVWQTNATHWFERQANLTADDNGTVEVLLHPDSIITVTTVERGKPTLQALHRQHRVPSQWPPSQHHNNRSQTTDFFGRNASWRLMRQKTLTGANALPIAAVLNSTKNVTKSNTARGNWTTRARRQEPEPEKQKTVEAARIVETPTITDAQPVATTTTVAPEPLTTTTLHQPPLVTDGTVSREFQLSRTEAGGSTKTQGRADTKDLRTPQGWRARWLSEASKAPRSKRNRGAANMRKPLNDRPRARAALRRKLFARRNARASALVDLQSGSRRRCAANSRGAGNSRACKREVSPTVEDDVEADQEQLASKVILRSSPTLRFFAARPSTPPVPEDVARGFLRALKSEYVTGTNEAVMGYYEEINVEMGHQASLDPFEDRVRRSESPHKTIGAIATGWGLSDETPVVVPPVPDDVARDFIQALTAEYVHQEGAAVLDFYHNKRVELSYQRILDPYEERVRQSVQTDHPVKTIAAIAREWGLMEVAPDQFPELSDKPIGGLEEAIIKLERLGFPREEIVKQLKDKDSHLHKFYTRFLKGSVTLDPRAKKQPAEAKPATTRKAKDDRVAASIPPEPKTALEREIMKASAKAVAAEQKVKELKRQAAEAAQAKKKQENATKPASQPVNRSKGEFSSAVDAAADKLISQQKMARQKEEKYFEKVLEEAAEKLPPSKTVRPHNIATANDSSVSKNGPVPTLPPVPANFELPVPPKSAEFPLPYSEDFNSYEPGALARYFADQGGAFEVRHAPGRTAQGGAKLIDMAFGEGSTNVSKSAMAEINGVLEQVVEQPPIAWSRGAPPPWTLLGGVNWTAVDVTVSTRLGEVPGTWKKNKLKQSRFSGLCVRLLTYDFFAQKEPEGYCLRIQEADELVVEDRLNLTGLDFGLSPFGHSDSSAMGSSKKKLTVKPAAWKVLAAEQTLASGALTPKAADSVKKGDWIELRLRASGSRLTAWIDDVEVLDLIDTSFAFGQVVLQCGYHHCQFDDFSAKRPEQVLPEKTPKKLRASQKEPAKTLVQRMSLASFDFHKRTCEPPVTLAEKRRDFNGWAGFAFTPRQELLVTALGRLQVYGRLAGRHAVHKVGLYRYPGAAKDELASLQLTMGDESATDESGWVWGELSKPVMLKEGEEYFLASEEDAHGGDGFYDNAQIDLGDYAESSGPIYKEPWERIWYRRSNLQGINASYGPVNARLLMAAPQTRGAKKGPSVLLVK